MNENNVGLLFQFLPKIEYPYSLTTQYDSIVTLDEYAQYIISPEELRFIDYSMGIKGRTRADYVDRPQIRKPTILLTNYLGQSGSTNGNLPSSAVNPQVCHSLPIIYPYDESNLKIKNKVLVK